MYTHDDVSIKCHIDYIIIIPISFVGFSKNFIFPIGNKLFC